MKLFFSILCKIYTALIRRNILFSPPSILFNNPKKIIDLTLNKSIHADITFSRREQAIILEAINDWKMFSNNSINFNIEFDLDTKYPYDHNLALIKSNPKDEVIVKYDGYFETNILGLCLMNQDETTDICLVPKRLKSAIAYRTTTVHELGHFLKLSHTAKPSIMHKHNYSNILYLTYVDAVEFAEKYGCDPEDLRYFRL